MKPDPTVRAFAASTATRVRRVAPVLLLCLVIHAAGYSSPASESAGRSKADAPKDAFDVCDVSFLIPPGDRPIFVSKAGPDGPILSRESFDKLPAFFRTEGHPNVDHLYEKLVVTGFRFDPAGPLQPGITDLAKAKLPNVRVIAQVLHEGKLTDAAVHMVFALGVKIDRGDIRDLSFAFDPAPRNALIEELKQLKQRNAGRGVVTTGAPLGVHPVFTSKAVTDKDRSDFLDGFESILRKYANEQNYFATAVMTTVDPSTVANPAEMEGKERWKWAPAAVRRAPSADGRLHVDLGPDQIHGTPDKPEPTSQTLTVDKGRRSGAVLSTRSAFPSQNGITINDVTKLLKERQAGDGGPDQGAVDAADLLENPDKIRIATQECVLCHTATPARAYALSGSSAALTRKQRFTPDPDGPAVTAGLPADVEKQAAEGGYRVMNFAFFKGTPSVSIRTVNESVEAARLINKWLAQQQ